MHKHEVQFNTSSVIRRICEGKRA